MSVAGNAAAVATAFLRGDFGFAVTVAGADAGFTSGTGAAALLLLAAGLAAGLAVGLAAGLAFDVAIGLAFALSAGFAAASWIGSTGLDTGFVATGLVATGLAADFGVG
ncbi:MAG: hypothetical protein Q7U14_10140, partial [Lacisediminimonas sp.]|nr:hypothetical protein [Lacisediminimonas sp.]